MALISLQFYYLYYIIHLYSNESGGKNMAIIKCPECGKDVSDKARSCPHCGNPIDTSIYCPKCGSKNVSVISGASKAVSVALWGVFAANKVKSNYKCNSCGHKF